MYRFAANLEWLFTEAGTNTADRVRAAAAYGFEAVEIWEWRNKDLPRLKDALAEHSVLLLSLIVDPKMNITDRANQSRYLRAVEESLVVALRLGAPNLVAVAGDDQPGIPRDEQHDALVDTLVAAARILAGTGVTLVLEPLNSRVDHAGTFLDTTSDGLRVIRDVDRAEVRLLFDAYHALVMGELIDVELEGSMELVGHVQIADVPGRHEIGTGQIDWAANLATLDRLGYRGFYGLEYLPTVDTERSLAEIKRLGRWTHPGR